MREAEGTSIAEQQTKLQQDIAKLMTTQLVQEIRKLGLPVESAEMAGTGHRGSIVH
jgi:membrane protease subunit (stomatin/prohibitin family)